MMHEPQIVLGQLVVTNFQTFAAYIIADPSIAPGTAAFDVFEALEQVLHNHPNYSDEFYELAQAVTKICVNRTPELTVLGKPISATVWQLLLKLDGSTVPQELLTLTLDPSAPTNADYANYPTVQTALAKPEEETRDQHERSQRAQQLSPEIEIRTSTLANHARKFEDRPSAPTQLKRTAKLILLGLLIPVAFILLLMLPTDTQNSKPSKHKEFNQTTEEIYEQLHQILHADTPQRLEPLVDKLLLSRLGFIELTQLMFNLKIRDPQKQKELELLLTRKLSKEQAPLQTLLLSIIGESQTIECYQAIFYYNSDDSEKLKHDLIKNCSSQEPKLAQRLAELE